MKYEELFTPSIEQDISVVEYLSQEKKNQIIEILSLPIEERFAGFHHTIVPEKRKYENYEGLETMKYMDPFIIDQNKIINSKAFRRSGDKAQVLPNVKEENSHMRNRLIHSMEVAELSVLFCEMMNNYFQQHKIPIRLNKELCKAIALGHDIGHTPLGHIGEQFITEEGGKDFEHNIFSTVVAEKIERKGNGLNLTPNTLEGIVHHTTSGGLLDLRGYPQEYAVVRIMDKIAYVLSDFNDGIREGYLKGTTTKLLNTFGQDQRERTLFILDTLVKETFKNGYVTFGDSNLGKTFLNVRGVLFDEYYLKVNKERHDLAYEKLDQVRKFFEKEWTDVDPAIAIALLTDVEVIKISKMLKSNPNISYQDLIKQYHIGVAEILPYVAGRDINWEKPAIKKEIDVKEIGEKLEIEKKFLVKELPENWETYPHEDIVQGYLAISPGNEVRVRKTQKSDGRTVYTRTIKEQKETGISYEKETEISEEKFAYLFSFVGDKTIEKRRYRIPLTEGLTAEMDIFSNGKRLVEVEFSNKEAYESFQMPEWFGEDVTKDKQYKNAQMATQNAKEKI